MTKSWSFICSFLAVGLLLVSAPTKAAITISFEDLENVAPVSDPVVALAGEFWLDSGDFLDYYGFDIDSPLVSPEIVIDVQVDNLTQATATIPLTVALYKWNGTGAGAYEVVASDGPAFNVSLSAIPMENGLDLTAPTDFNNRRYLIGVSGTGVFGEGLTSGYSGVLTVTAIPEPSTVAFLLAGLGVLGMTKTRKSSCSGSVRV